MSEYELPRRVKKGRAKRKNSSNKVDSGKTNNKNKRLNGFGYFLAFSLAFIMAGMTAFNLYLMSLPPIKNLKEFKPNIVTKFYSADGEIIKTFTAYTFSKVELKDIPEPMLKAFIATEDKKFYSHHGYDLMGLARSTVANIAAGKVVQGASTITQQLARILFLSNEKTFSRKIKEFIISARIEKTISKDKILEMYLNNVYLGSGAYGVEGAAQIYFNKHLNQLTLSEMALIAGLPQAPSIYSPFNDKNKAEKRRNQVLMRMYKTRYIDKKTYESAKAEKITLSSVPALYTTNKAPYFCDYIMRQMEKLGYDEVEISQGGYKIVTTLDYNTQLKANEAAVKILNSWGMKGTKQQAAIFAFSPIDGRIIAYTGGKDYSKSQYDRVQAVRPPGSAFKPFIYAAALEKDLSPNDMIDDLPFKIGSWSPRNYGNKYRGPIPAYTALMVSSNVCAARVIQYVGIRPVIQLARLMGFTTPLEYDATIALGSNGVKLYEITRAYGAFANGGFKVEPYGIERIESSRGKILYEAPKAKSTKVISVDTAAKMTAMLKTVITNGTGMAANIGKPAAAKTGTTDDYKDACFIGYTPDVVTGVWVGNDDNTKMGTLTGGTVPAIIWKEVMKVATAPFGNADFDYEKVNLIPFKATTSQVITPEEAKKGFEKAEEDALKAKEEELKELVPEATTVQPTNMPKMPENMPGFFKRNEQSKTPTIETETKPNTMAPIPMATGLNQQQTNTNQ